MKGMIIKMSSNNNKYRNFNQLINIFYNEELEDKQEQKTQQTIKNKIKIEPKIIYTKPQENIKIEFYIGNAVSQYKIKDLSGFYSRMKTGETYKYGENVEFAHIKENFTEESQPLLKLVLKYAEIIKYGNTNSNANYRFGASALNESIVTIDDKGLDDIFEILKNTTVKFQKATVEEQIKFEPNSPDIKIILEKIDNDNYALYPNIDSFKINILNGYKNTYILTSTTLYKCDKNFSKTTLKILKIFIENYSPKIEIGQKQLQELFSIVIPKIQEQIIYKNITKEEIQKYTPRQVKSKIYLDFDKKNLSLILKFIYNNKEYNPLEPEIKKQNGRNIIKETQVLNLLLYAGFMLDAKKHRFVLVDEEKIYNFITHTLATYANTIEILATEQVKNKMFKEPKIKNLGIKIENNLLEIDLNKINIDPKELVEVLKKYNVNKKFYRLKDGTFLKLENNEEIEFLNKLMATSNANYKEIQDGILYLPAYRSLYLEKLLKDLPNVEVEANQKYNEITNNLDKETIKKHIEIPYKLDKILRYYQKVGFSWLQTLDHYKFGGILADDMGLGKTIQILSVIMSYLEQTPKSEKRASLVVAPSSLALNWKNEALKFTKDIQTLVIHGDYKERKQQIESIEKYDLIITSYDLLKRDIELYKNKNYNFRFVIADEAQYLKNSNTKNAISIKQINADTRFALTGTPMENSLAELWSIFDFIMPQYLYSYRKFRNLFEVPIVKDKDEQAMQRLKMLIEPFVLRRTKKQVLTELPEKTISILTNSMYGEQKELYLAYLMQAKQELQETIKIDGFEKSQMKILSILTRLRQICCHPSLFIQNYSGTSSKLEQCMEIIREGAASNHKTLVFSVYTSMFPIIEKELQKNKIKYFKLTGSTKVNERVNLVDEFNKNDDIKVFLISLKAGGTGLNLTGADVVIHYDPWWNVSAENQATDRAYRIGQKHNVQVYKLITKDSIEEKIYRLQQNKSALIDDVLDINTSFISGLSKDEIINLFN